MAKVPTTRIVFADQGDDCGYREAVGLPEPLPQVTDNFDWQTRDYDGFRMLMLEELAARVPERRRFTAADLEVVVVEALATVLDQLSDAVDRVSAEAYLETARRPDSVHRLLRLIGYDAAAQAEADGLLPEGDPTAALQRLWTLRPWLMEEARVAGPRSLRRQVRMVTIEDVQTQLEAHPLVRQAGATIVWGGAWPVVRIAVWLRNDQFLANSFVGSLDEIRRFYQRQELTLWPDTMSFRDNEELLVHYIEQLRMVGQEYELSDVSMVGINLGFTVRIIDGFFQSEVRQALHVALGTGTGGFFELGRHRCGEDLRLGDVLEVLTGTAGVDSVVVEEFARRGGENQLQTARITIGPDELAVCDNKCSETNPSDYPQGRYRLTLVGGRQG